MSVAAAAAAGAAELGVLVPLSGAQGMLTRPAPGGKAEAPVVKRVREGKLFEAIQHEARHGFTATALALDELAMRSAGQGARTTWLMLSQEDGGFARRGFWLEEGAALRWMDEPMVDLVVDAASVADGSFEEIFAHELGHVMLRRLLPNLPHGYSRAPHHSFSITDQQTAFDEGWAIHFQGLARRFTLNQRLRAEDAGLEGKPYLPLWLSNLDRATRIDGMRRNWFVHRQVPLPAMADPIQARQLSTLFDRARLKNAAQMLASEGVVATFFYRHLVPPPGQDAGLETRYAAMFAALRVLSAEPLTVTTPLVPALAQVLLRTSPEQGKRFIATLMEVSHGALASPRLAAAAEALAQPGRVGDAAAFVPMLQAARKQFAAELEQVTAHPERLAAHAGPAVWLLLPTPGAGGESVVIDLNTAEREHLLALPGIDAGAAGRALHSRATGGHFYSIEDFAARAGLAPEGRLALAAMAQAASRLGPHVRD
ncbi:helix-hairpin-helix domain-containing protein [Massilia sp. UMI-21]|nr:helix-hairpin-helix domain-containing protein [Massilia sp. UMI-21]